MKLPISEELYVSHQLKHEGLKGNIYLIFVVDFVMWTDILKYPKRKVDKQIETGRVRTMDIKPKLLLVCNTKTEVNN